VPPKLSDSHFLILYSTRYGHGAEHFWETDRLFSSWRPAGTVHWTTVDEL
jgi:hypothetical protein